MKIVTLLFLLTISTATCAQSFGDDFMKWVKQDANRQSREYAEKHWHLYWLNLFTTRHDSVSRDLIVADSLLNRMVKFNESSIKQADLASLEQLVFIKEQYSQQLQQLYDIIGVIENTGNRTHLPSKDYNEFIRAGYEHFGTTTLMESYADFSNGNESIDKRYSVTFTTTTPAAGEGSESGYQTQGTGLEPKNDVERAILTTGSYLMYSPKTAPYGMALYAVYGLIKIWDIEKYKKQMEILQDAFDLLPEKLITPKEAFDIYTRKSEAAMLQFDTLSARKRETARALDSLSRILIRYNFELVSMADNMLHAQKVDVIANRYQQNPAGFDRLFNHQLILSSIDDVYQMATDVKKLERKMALAGAPLKQLACKEELLDAKTEYTAILKWMESNPRLLPIHPQIQKTLLSLQSPATPADTLLTSLQWCRKSLSTKGKKGTLTKKNVEVVASQKKMAIENDYQKPGYEFYHLSGTYGSGKFYLSAGSGAESYSLQFPRNGAGLAESPYDGGYAYDSKKASVEVDKMVANMNQRITEMDRAAAEVERLRPEWNRKNLEAVQAQQVNTVNNMAVQQHTSIRHTMLNQPIAQAYTNQLNQFLLQPLTQQRLNRFYEQHHVTPNMLQKVPKVNIRPNGYIPSTADIRTPTYKHLSAIEKDVYYEANKATADFEAVWKRIENNRSNHQPDIVFSSEEAFRKTVSLSKAYLMTALAISKADNTFYRNNPLLAKKTAIAFTDNARMIRYHSLGMLPEYKLNDNNFYVNMGEVRKVLKNHANEYYSFCSPDLSMEQSDCNKFSTYFLKDVYGIGDFYNQPDGQDFVTLNGSKIPVFNTTQMSDYVINNWTELGNAGDQLVLNMAGLYAGMGFAVIALKPGHVAIVLPTDPNHYTPSGKWNASVPNILNYAQVQRLSELNIQLDVPLSLAWKYPKDVKIYIKPQLKDY